MKMRSEERAHNERLANDRYREAGRDKHPLRSLRSLLFCILYFSCFIALVSCHYSRPNLEDEHLSKETRDSLAYLFERHYTWNTNLEVLADSVNLACLPVKDCYNMLYRGDRVVVAEFAIHPADSVDSVWVKLAHSQEVQGWLRESEMMHAFVPTDSISQAIDAERARRISLYMGVAIRISDYSFLGGIRAVIPGRHILIDNSFQTRLEEARHNFKFTVQEAGETGSEAGRSTSSKGGNGGE